MSQTRPSTPLRWLWSLGAVIAGFAVVVALSIGVDGVLHGMKIYPPPGEPMHDPALNALALAYRSLFTVVGGYVTARLAPLAPMRHVLVLALIGLAAGAAGWFSPPAWTWDRAGIRSPWRSPDRCSPCWADGCTSLTCAYDPHPHLPRGALDGPIPENLAAWHEARRAAGLSARPGCAVVLEKDSPRCIRRAVRRRLPDRKAR